MNLTTNLKVVNDTASHCLAQDLCLDLGSNFKWNEIDWINSYTSESISDQRVYFMILSPLIIFSAITFIISLLTYIVA